MKCDYVSSISTFNLPSASEVLLLNAMETNMSRLFSLIQFYSGLGLRHWEMLMSLSNVDGIVTRLLTLRRHLRTLWLFREKTLSDLLDIAAFLQDRLN